MLIRSASLDELYAFIIRRLGPRRLFPLIRPSKSLSLVCVSAAHRCLLERESGPMSLKPYIEGYDDYTDIYIYIYIYTLVMVS